MSEQAQRIRPSSVRKPSGTALFRMVWSNVLLLHWPMDLRALRKQVPAGLEIDSCEGCGWLTVVASTVSGMRPMITPPVPGLSSFLEVGARTYVRQGGQAGVFLFSMDASNPAVVWLARSFFHLPYFRARMEAAVDGDSKRFASRRSHQGATFAEFACEWTAGAPRPPPRKGDLLQFLTDRHQIYVGDHRRLFTFRTWHEPWALREAAIEACRCSLLEAAGFGETGEPALAQQADKLALSAGPLTALSHADAAEALFGTPLSPPAAPFKP